MKVYAMPIAGPIAVHWQRIEGLILFVSGLALYGLNHDVVPWWGAVLLFFAPDISFAGYILGPKVGAAIYNAVHIYALGAALVAFGLTASVPIMTLLGGLWLAHCGFDRMLGYGLKSPEGFSTTHLGHIGK